MAIITIDGPAGTGKSTVAKEVAKRLNVPFFDTGAMYRAVALGLLQKGIREDDEEGIKQYLEDFAFSMREISGRRRYFLEEKDVTDAIRSIEVTKTASNISKLFVVRKKITQMQRDFGKIAGGVFEGRDMGSVVFPHAQLKIFLTASSEIRAQRRYDELTKENKGVALSFEKVRDDMLLRDQADSSRALSPLKKAEDAIEIDTTMLSIEDVVALIIQYYQEIIG